MAGLLSLAACGDDDPAVGAANDPNVFATEDDDGGADGIDASKGSGNGDLRAVLLNADDLPDGWSEVPSARTESTDGSNRIPGP